MRVFKHLTFTDRIRIEKWKKEGMRTREIAEKLRVDPSTVYRELKRGSYDRLNGTTWELIPTYSPDIAEQKYQAHLREKGPNLKIGKDHELAAYIERTIIDKDCSPAAVYGYAQEEGKTFKTHISVPTIYSYIKKGIFLNLTQEELPRKGVHKNKYGKVRVKDPARAPAGESIEKRPEEIQSREEFGHWEMDTVYSGKKKSTAALLVLTERKTRNENIILVPNRRAETTVRKRPCGLSTHWSGSWAQRNSASSIKASRWTTAASSHWRINWNSPASPKARGRKCITATRILLGSAGATKTSTQ